MPVIGDLLDEYPDLTAVRVHEEIAKMGFVGGHTIVKDSVRQLRKRQPTPVVRFETGPGEQAQMDWSDCTVKLTTGPTKFKCFSYVLAYSRRMYVTFSPRDNFFSLIRRHVEAFKFFGGCAATCLYDNMKTAVLRWEEETPIYNPRFLLFASHYGYQPRACRPYCPKTKGKVERPFGYIKGNFLNGRRFHDLADLNAQVLDWLSTTADVRIHGTTRRRPIDLYLEEKPHLLPLPLRGYDTCEIAYRSVSPEALVAWKGNAYSVPPTFIGQLVIARCDDHELVILSPLFQEIARHPLSHVPTGQKFRLPEHRVTNTKHGQIPLDLIRERFAELGDSARTFLIGLARQHPTTMRAHLAHILGLKQAYDPRDILDAIKRAIRFNAFDHRTIENILQRHAQPRSLEAAIARTGRSPDPAKASIQRDASHYSDLFQAFAQGRKEDDNAASGECPGESDHPEDDNGEGDPA